MRSLRFTLLFVALALVTGAFSRFPTHAATPRIPPDWDSRLNALHVTYHPAGNCSGGCWRLVQARFEDVEESGGNHNIYGRLLTVEGDAPADLPWHVAYPDGNILIFTKAAPEWADFPMFAEYDPDEGQSGPYYAYAGNDITHSDVVRGMGLPERQHVNFRLTWQWQDSSCTACIHYISLPIIYNQH